MTVVEVKKVKRLSSKRAMAELAPLHDISHEYECVLTYK